MATEEDTETRGILVTAPRQRSPSIRTYSRKKPSNKLPSLKPSRKQYPVKPLQQVQLKLRVTKRLSETSKRAEQPLSNRIAVVLPENASFGPHDYDDAYVGGDEDEDMGDDEEGESENDDDILNITRTKAHTAFVPPSPGPDVYDIPDNLPDDSEDQKENQIHVVFPSRTPRFTQQLIRGRPPGNGPRRPHLIFNKLPARNRFKKLPQRSGSKPQTSALRSHPGDGFSDDEIKRTGLVLPIRSGKLTTSDTHAGELDISRAPPLPKHKRDQRRANLDDNSFDMRPRKKTKHTQEQAIIIPDDHRPNQGPTSPTEPSIIVGQNPEIPKQTSQSILYLPQPHPNRSTPPRTIPTQILIPSLRQAHNPRSNLPHRVVIYPPPSEEDQSDEDSTYTLDDEITIIPQSNDLETRPEGPGEEQQENSGYETYISKTSRSGQRSSSVPIKPMPYSNKQEKEPTNNVGARVQVSQGLARRRELKRCTTQ